MNSARAIRPPKTASPPKNSEKETARKVPVIGEWHFALDENNSGTEFGWAETIPAQSTQLETGRPWEYWHPGYDGVAWYWKEISQEEIPEYRVCLLRFEAVSYWCECWVNGHHAGIHEGAYDAFSFDITAHLRKGKNLLAIRVINPPETREIEGLRSGAPLSQSDLPIGKSAWYYNFGGIWGHVWLESLPAVWLDDLAVDADWQSRELTIRWTTENTAEVDECDLHITIRERNSGHILQEADRVLVTGHGSEKGEWSLRCDNLAEWSPEAPSLYLLEATLGSSHGAHKVTRQFGLRDFRIVNGRFSLNGKPIRLKGLLQQGAYPRRLAAPDSWRMGARELLTIKKAGFNFVRIHLKPAGEWYLDLADRLGLLVMMEPPIGWIANGPNTEKRVLREIRTVVKTNRSRACVIMWGLFNESFHLLGFDPREFRKMAERMMLAARETDASRLLIDTSGGYAVASLEGAETMIHDTFHNVASRYMQPRSATVEEIVDVHVYCPMPPSTAVVDRYRVMSPNGLPMFMAEYGAAETPPDFAKVLAAYSDRDRTIGLEDWQLHQDFHTSLQVRFQAAGLTEIFGSVQNWISALNQERADEVRTITLAALCNPHLSGLCYCQVADASGELFGVLDFWRRPKPLLAELSRALSTPAAGLFPSQYWISAGKPLKIVFASGPDLGFSIRQLHLEITDPVGGTKTFPFSARDHDPARPHEISLEITAITPGVHTAISRITLVDGQHLEASCQFGVLATLEHTGIRTSARFVDAAINAAVERCGFDVETFGNNYRNKDAVVLLEWPVLAGRINTHAEILGQIRNIIHSGGAAIIFNPDTPMLQRWLLPHFIGVQPVMRTGAYIKTTSTFDGIPSGCVAGRMHADILPERWDNGDDVHAAGGIIDVGAFSMHMWTRPAEYFWAAGLYRIPLGRGQLFISHLKLLDQLDSSPLAARVFQNLVRHAQSFIQPGGHELLLRRCIDRI